MRVQREVDGEVLEFTDEEALIENILDVIQDRFSGAEDAPISNCSLTDELDDFGFTDLGLQIIRGEVQIPSDVDEATTTLLEAIGELGATHMDDVVDTSMNTNQYQNICRRMKERTSSSRSKMHFGHYIATAESTILLRGMALKISLTSNWGCPPDRWRNVLMVMLEKKVGAILIPKLRAILLKEADNNMHDGHVFGGK
jgi:hypothetical protein